MKKICLFLATYLLIAHAFAEGFVDGVPVEIMKSDWSSLHLTYIKFATPIPNQGCSSGGGVVILDSNESSKAALTFALTAFASGKKFRCYVQNNQCSIITGAVETYPVCTVYPSISN